MAELTDQLPVPTAAFHLAGLAKGVTGPGLPTFGVGLLSLVMAPAEAASLAGVRLRRALLSGPPARPAAAPPLG